MVQSHFDGSTGHELTARILRGLYRKNLRGERTAHERLAMSDAFTLRIYIPSGDPEGVRIVDRMNWTGRGYFVPRDRWVDMKARAERGTPAGPPIASENRDGARY
jgi:hypothetical protein